MKGKGSGDVIKNEEEFKSQHTYEDKTEREINREREREREIERERHHKLANAINKIQNKCKLN